LVSEAFLRKGYLALDNIDDGPDGGVDIVLRKDGQLNSQTVRVVVSDEKKP
jgi:hypothetical protein